MYKAEIKTTAGDLLKYTVCIDKTKDSSKYLWLNVGFCGQSNVLNAVWRDLELHLKGITAHAWSKTEKLVIDYTVFHLSKRRNSK